MIEVAENCKPVPNLFLVISASSRRHEKSPRTEEQQDCKTVSILIVAYRRVVILFNFWPKVVI